MRGADIANQLKGRLPKYTDDFSEKFTVKSLTRSGATITAVTSTAHGADTGDNVTIKGAKEPINITSLTRSDDIVTAVCSVPHKLPNPTGMLADNIPIVEINGSTPSDYNGSFTLFDTPDYSTFQYKITTTPASPAATAGDLLLSNDLFLYNGQKTITVVNTATFTYEIESDNLQSPAQGTMEMVKGTRIGWAASFEITEAHYSEDSTRKTQNWLYIVVNHRETFKKDTTTLDVTSIQEVNAEYRYDTIQTFSIFIYIPAKTSILAGIQSDQAREYIQPLLKSIANFLLPSNLTEGCLRPVTFQGDEMELFNKAYYVHRFDFVAKGEIVNEDTIDAVRIVPLEELDSDTQDKDINLKVDFTQ